MLKKHRENLEKLAAYLEALPEDYQDFDMSIFSGNNSEPTVNPCGSAACAVGHGPNAGIRPYADATWEAYACRVFGVELHGTGHFAHPGGQLWHWCFEGDWCDIDNSAKGAAWRIRYYLQAGQAPFEMDFFDPELRDQYYALKEAGQCPALSA